MSREAHAPESLAHPKYRKDIDGLRAVAVLGVVLFHAFPQSFRGGFIGVDLFFVISGFLISTIIVESLQRGTFTFGAFYRRRILRIFPALMVVLAACLLIGWRVLVPSEFRQLGRHVAAGAGFLANFIFWHESGYFDTVAEVKPLLHLWSLGIEEQIYIFWPLLLLAAWKKRIPLLRLMAAAFAASFLFNLVLAQKNPTGDFYSPFARLWEFLAGACLGSLPAAWRTGAPAAAAWSGLASAAGCALLLLGALLIDRSRQFPGAWALLPVAGAAMLIWAGPGAWCNKWILSNRALVWVGLVSFPLYLWHWPLLSYSRIVAGEAPSLAVRSGCVLLSLALAAATYWGVEKPIRFGGRGPAWAKALLAIALLMVFLGLLADKKRWLPESRSLVALKSFDFTISYPAPEGARHAPDEKYMLIGPGAGEDAGNQVLLLGDSHAAQYIPTLAEAVRRGVAGGSAPATLKYTKDMIGLAQLPEFSREAAADPAVSAVVISFFWALTYQSEKINNAVRCCGAAIGGSVGGEAHRAPPPQELFDSNDRALEAALGLLTAAGKRVLLVLDNPFGEELSPKGLVQRDYLRGVEIRVKPLGRQAALARTEPARSRVMRIARKAGVGVVDPFEALCSEDPCLALFGDGATVYKDYDHLSIHAVKHFVRYLDSAVAAARSRPRASERGAQ